MNLLQNPNAMWGGAILLGVLASCWQRVAGLVTKVTSLLIARAIVTSSAGGMGLSLFIYLKRFPSVRLDRKYFGASYMQIKSLNRIQLASYEMATGDHVFWVHGRPLLANCDASSQLMSLSLTWLRGTIDLDKLLLAATEHTYTIVNDKNEKSVFTRFQVARATGRSKRHGSAASWPDSGGSEPRQRRNTEDSQASPVNSLPNAVSNECPLRDMRGRRAVRLIGLESSDVGFVWDLPGEAIDRLALSPEVLAVVDDVRHWYEAAAWYYERDIPWRHGVALFGAPGNGKTATIRALAQDLDMPITVFDLASMDNAEFLENWERQTRSAPCVALFEDLDSIFDGRKNITGVEGGLTFDCFLNALGGADVANGVLTVITTNKPETLDPALASTEKNTSRPGRIEAVVELGPPDVAGRRKMAQRVLVDVPELIEEIVAAGDGDSGARFLDRCRKVALDRYWAPKQAAFEQVEPKNSGPFEVFLIPASLD